MRRISLGALSDAFMFVLFQNMASTIIGSRYVKNRFIPSTNIEIFLKSRFLGMVDHLYIFTCMAFQIGIWGPYILHYRI